MTGLIKMSKTEKHIVQLSVYFHGMPAVFLRDRKTVRGLGEAVASLLEPDAELEMESKATGKAFCKGAKFIFRSADITRKTFQYEGDALVKELTNLIKPMTRWSLTIKKATRLIF